MRLDEAKRFVRLCWETRSLEAVASAFGMDNRKVSNRAATLRRRGVLIPRLASSQAAYKRPELHGRDVAELREYSRRLAAQSAAAQVARRNLVEEATP